MAELLGIGLTHYPGLHMLDEDMSVFLRRTLSGKRIPDRTRDPHNWPEEMRLEWDGDAGAAAGRLAVIFGMKAPKPSSGTREITLNPQGLHLTNPSELSKRVGPLLPAEK